MDGFERLQRLKREFDRIGQKIALAEEAGVKRADVGGAAVSLSVLRRMRDGLQAEIGRSALAEAWREIREAQDEARRLRDGAGPRRPAGPGDRDGDGAADAAPAGAGAGAGGNGGGGGGSGGGGPGGGPGGGSSGGSGGGGPGGGAGGAGGKTLTAPEAVSIYVRSETEVWAWDRRTQTWKSFGTGAPVVQVKFVKGGLLALTRDGAALFDSGYGEWLTPLASGAPLVDGEGRPA